MTNKIYTAPKINIVEMSCTTIMAGSGVQLMENGTSGPSADYGDEVQASESWAAHSASRVYFDSWADDPDDL
jgi:hypothetical protein